MKTRLRESLMRLSPVRRGGLAFLCGAAGVAGLAPFYIWPLTILSFALCLVLMLGATTKKQLFWTGWFYAFGYFTFGLYWISLALHIDWAQWWWLTPFAAIGLPLYLSIHFGLAALVLWKLRDNTAYFLVGSIVSFGLAEYFRGTLFTGFPWNLHGYIFMDSPISLNLNWMGAYGLNLVVFALAAALAGGLYKKRAWALAALLTGSVYAYGYIATFGAHAVTPMTDRTVMIVQPNIAQIDKWDRSKAELQFEEILQQSSTPDDNRPDLVVWPETAMTFRKPDLPVYARDLSNILASGQYLLSGITDVKANRDLTFDYFNSLIALNGDAKAVGQYNKHHLVPFGEYVPMRKYLRFGGVAQGISSTGDFKPGPGPQTMTLPNNLRISPLICYEIIFPGRSFKKGDRPDAIVNITNDGWYLGSIGPHQHLAMSRARAIETGLPVIRAANTGISAVIDPFGRIILSLPLQEKGTILTGLPSAHPPTLFSRYGNGLFLVFSLLLAGLLISLRIKGNATK